MVIKEAELIRGVMRNEWMLLLKQCDCDNMLMGEKWFNAIFDAYTQTHRHFHNFRYLHDVIMKTDELAYYMDVYQDTLGLELVTWFRWYSWNPMLKPEDNRRESARMMIECFRTCGLVDQPMARQAIIMMTQPGLARERWPVHMNIIQDAGLEWMVVTQGTYLVYLKSLRKEYGYLTDADFAMWRRQHCENLLAQEHLYRCEPYWGPVERMAIANLEEELSAMSEYLDSAQGQLIRS